MDFPTQPFDARSSGRRPLGTMIAYGFGGVSLDGELALARRLGATVLEALPDWRSLPDPQILRSRLDAEDFRLWSAHGCWSGQAIRADRVDLAALEPTVQRQSVDDLRRALDWLATAGGTCLIVHPGGLSDPADASVRRAILGNGLVELAGHARTLGLTVCVENMPRGVWPGSSMTDLAGLLDELDCPELALALDTGHAQIVTDPVRETLAAGHRLRTTHVHDNDGRQDTHLPPGRGMIDWNAWGRALDEIGYEGPIVLECVRQLRNRPEEIDEAFLDRLRTLTGP